MIRHDDQGPSPRFKASNDPGVRVGSQVELLRIRPLRCSLIARAEGGRPAMFGRSLGILATQLLRRLPVNLRPALGISPSLNSKALALLASSAVRIDELSCFSGAAPHFLTDRHPYQQWSRLGIPVSLAIADLLLSCQYPYCCCDMFRNRSLVEAWNTDTSATAIIGDSVNSCYGISREPLTLPACACPTRPWIGRKSPTRACWAPAFLCVPGQLCDCFWEVDVRPSSPTGPGPPNQWGLGLRCAGRPTWMDDQLSHGVVLNALDTYRRVTNDVEVEQESGHAWRGVLAQDLFWAKR